MDETAQKEQIGGQEHHSGKYLPLVTA